jgi:RNA polymerase sigma-70 factor (ECF subfamily)
VETTPTIDPRTDEELVEAINGGDDDAFATLYYRYRDWVMRHARRWTGCREDALDVLQETFAYLVRKTPDLRLTAKMTTFLYPVVKNISMRLRDRQRLTLVDPAALDQIPASVAADKRGGALLTNDLTAVMSELPDEQREVILLRYVDGLTLAEIADCLRIPVGTVKSRLHYAIAALRRDPRTQEYFER